MWSVLNGKEKSKRKDILVNVDEIFETKAAIMGKYKLVQGMRPIFDDFFGKNPKDYSPETYDILAVTSSMAGRTIMNLNDYDLPREENMIEMRDKATIRCGAKLDPKFKKCYEPCLFDIQNDPCETTDILQQNPEVSTIGFIFIALIWVCNNRYFQIAQNIRKFLDDHRSIMMGQTNTYIDPNGYPDKSEGYWMPWLKSDPPLPKDRNMSVIWGPSVFCEGYPIDSPKNCL